MRIILLLLSLLLAFLSGWLAHSLYVTQTQPSIEEHATIIQNQIQKIAQFATVEQRYSEVFSHKEIGFIDFPSFNKSAIVQARARVVMGFDLESIQVDVDHSMQRVTVRNWPEPKEMAFEFDTRYSDLSQGLFNWFDSKELNAVDNKLEQELRRSIDYEALRMQSYEQAEEYLTLIRENLELSGWTLSVQDWPQPAVDSTELPIK